jgi:mycothiol system anti-sigma-R factor
MSTISNTDCEAVIRLMFAYLDGELEDEQRGGVDEHLKLCRSCFSRAEFERRLKSQLSELGRESVPAPLEERVRALMSQFKAD